MTIIEIIRFLMKIRKTHETAVKISKSKSFTLKITAVIMLDIIVLTTICSIVYAIISTQNNAMQAAILREAAKISEERMMEREEEKKDDVQSVSNLQYINGEYDVDFNKVPGTTATQTSVKNEPTFGNDNWSKAFKVADSCKELSRDPNLFPAWYPVGTLLCETGSAVVGKFDDPNFDILTMVGNDYTNGADPTNFLALPKGINIGYGQYNDTSWGNLMYENPTGGPVVFHTDNTLGFTRSNPWFFPDVIVNTIDHGRRHSMKVNSNVLISEITNSSLDDESKKFLLGVVYDECHRGAVSSQYASVIKRVLELQEAGADWKPWELAFKCGAFNESIITTGHNSVPGVSFNETRAYNNFLGNPLSDDENGVMRYTLSGGKKVYQTNISIRRYTGQCIAYYIYQNSLRTSTSTLGNKSTKGNYQGKYIVELDDVMNGKNWAWYHQSGTNYCDCQYNADKIGHAKWKGSYFGDNGCAVYTLASIVTNVTGNDVTPLDILHTLQWGDTGAYDFITGQYKSSGDALVNNAEGKYFASGTRNIKRYESVEEVCRVYGLDYYVLQADDPDFDEKLIEAMKFNIMGFASYHAKFEWYGGQAHFLAIRDTDGKNVYPLTSSHGHGTATGGATGHEGARKVNNCGIPPAQVKKFLNNYMCIFLIGTKDDVLRFKSGQYLSDENIVNEPSVNGDFEVHFIDVGQGEAILATDGKNSIMIDVGSGSDSSINIGQYLKDNGIKNLDYVILTHRHDDHVGSLSDVVNSCKISNVLSDFSLTDEGYVLNGMIAADDSGAKMITAKTGQSYSAGNIKIKIIMGRQTDIENSGNNDTNVNNESLIVKVTYGSTSFLFVGDAEKWEEDRLLSMGADVKADVLAVGHHGGTGSSTDAFLKEVKPKIGVISCGSGYGFPFADAVQRLQNAGVSIYRTDSNGTVVVKSDGNNIVVK